MAQLAGILRKEDATLLTDIPASDVTSAVNAMLATYEQARNEAFSLLVDSQTTERQERVKAAGVIRGQLLDRDGRPLENRVAGEYEVAYWWDRYGWALGWGREDMAYLTVADLERNVNGIVGGNKLDHITAMWKALYNNANFQFTDNRGTLTIRALANQDGTLFPLPNGQQAEANHYFTSGYAASAISDTNNPFALLKSKLRVFAPGARVVAFINELQLAKIQSALTSFTDIPVAGISPGFGQSIATPFGDVSVPGEFVGVDGASGVHVYTYSSYVPDGFMTGLVVGAPAPLRLRVPEPVILQGFKLEAEEDHDPFYKRTYRERFGYAVRNRLSVAVLQLTASGTYTVPTEYA